MEIPYETLTLGGQQSSTTLEEKTNSLVVSFPLSGRIQRTPTSDDSARPAVGYFGRLTFIYYRLEVRMTKSEDYKLSTISGDCDSLT